MTFASKYNSELNSPATTTHSYSQPLIVNAESNWNPQREKQGISIEIFSELWVPATVP